MTTPGYRDALHRALGSDRSGRSRGGRGFPAACATPSNRKLGPVEPRLAVVRAQIAATGTYVHTPDELAYGARVAWRNSSRCIGRLYWRSLVVLDRRRARTRRRDLRPAGAPPVHGRRHRGGQPRAGRSARSSRSSPQAQPGRPYARIWNEQLIRYAGYRDDDGGVIGDPRHDRLHRSRCATSAGAARASVRRAAGGDRDTGRRACACSTCPSGAVLRGAADPPGATAGSPSSACAGTPSRRSPTCG